MRWCATVRFSWASSLLNTPTNCGSDAFGQRLDSNAAFLPNSLKRPGLGTHYKEHSGMATSDMSFSWPCPLVEHSILWLCSTHRFPRLFIPKLSNTAALSLHADTSLGKKVGNHSVRTSISVSSTDLKFKLRHSTFRDSEQIQSLQLIGQAAKFKFESKI